MNGQGQVAFAISLIVAMGGAFLAAPKGNVYGGAFLKVSKGNELGGAFLGI